MPVVGTAPAELEKLTRRHGVKLNPAVACSVEEAALAVGDVVGHDSVRSASRMNGAIVIFVESTAKVGELVEKGVVIQDAFTTVSPLTNPATKVMISNVPPFIRNEALSKELSRYGQLVSPIRMVSLGCKSPKLKHVVCHRRQVMMILQDKQSDLNLSFSISVEGFNYMVFASSESMRCFGCGAEGHQVRSCPGNHGAAGGAPRSFAAAVVVANVPVGAEPVAPAPMEALAEEAPPTVEPSPAGEAPTPDQGSAIEGAPKTTVHPPVDDSLMSQSPSEDEETMGDVKVTRNKKKGKKKAAFEETLTEE
ncbi:unnamed protein product, partial [Tetraodon nigroviridis]